MSADHLPVARAGLHTLPTELGLQVQDPVHGQTWQLQGLHARVWAAIDVAQSVEALRAHLGQSGGLAVQADQLWAALDDLADLGLLTHRASPPAHEQVSLHRPIGRRAWAVGGLAVAAAPMVFASSVADEQKAKDQHVVAAREERDKRSKADARLAEQDIKKSRSGTQDVAAAEQKNKVGAEQAAEAERKKKR